MSRASREKGKRGEREVAEYLRERGYEARRGQQFCGSNGDADVVGVPGLHIEVKRTEQCRLYDYLDQAESDARTGEVPVVFHRQSRKKWVAIMDMGDFMDLYEEAQSARACNALVWDKVWNNRGGYPMDTQ